MPNWNYRVWCSVLVVVLAATTGVNAALADPFADAVVSFAPGLRPGVDPKQEFPEAALGAPDFVQATQTGLVVLGSGGVLTLEFKDNSLTGSGNSDADLLIWEFGPDQEDVFVRISKTGAVGDWIDVGKTVSPNPEIDIDPYIANWKDRFYYVELTDDPNQGGTAPGPWTGADIDAVQALSFSEGRDIPEPLTMISVLMGLTVASTCARRRRRA